MEYVAFADMCDGDFGFQNRGGEINLWHGSALVLEQQAASKTAMDSNAKLFDQAHTMTAAYFMGL
jgi:hypothetical protein